MVRGNLAAALQGLAVVPLFAGFDLDAAEGTPGRIFSYDVTGGNYEERGYASVGSGSLFARNSLKKTWRPGLDRRGRRRGPSSRPSTTPRTTTPPPAAPTSCAASTRSSTGWTPRAPSGCPTRRSPPSRETITSERSANEGRAEP